MSDQIKAAVQDMAAGMGASDRVLGFMEGAIYTLEAMKSAAQAQQAEKEVEQ